jgi:hypothetical protein
LKPTSKLCRAGGKNEGEENNPKEEQKADSQAQAGAGQRRHKKTIHVENYLGN